MTIQDAIALIRRLMVQNRVTAVKKQHEAEEIAKRRSIKLSRFRGYDADRGVGTCYGSDGSVVSGKSQTTGNIKPGQPVNLAIASGLITYDQKPTVKRPEAKKPKVSLGKVKYLIQVTNGATTTFYVAGWQTEAVLAYTLPSGISSSDLIQATVDNLGGANWSIDLGWRVSEGVFRYIQVKNGSVVMDQVIPAPLQTFTETIDGETNSFTAPNDYPLVCYRGGYWWVNYGLGENLTITNSGGNTDQTSVVNRQIAKLFGNAIAYTSGVDTAITEGTPESQTINQNYSYNVPILAFYDKAISLSLSSFTDSEGTTYSRNLTELETIQMSPGSAGIYSKAITVESDSGSTVTSSYVFRVDTTETTISADDGLPGQDEAGYMDVSRVGYSFIRYPDNQLTIEKISESDQEVPIDFYNTAFVKGSTRKEKVYKFKPGDQNATLLNASYNAV